MNNTEPEPLEPWVRYLLLGSVTFVIGIVVFHLVRP